MDSSTLPTDGSLTQPLSFGGENDFHFDPTAAVQTPQPLHNPDFADNPDREPLKAILNDRQNLGGQLPQVVEQSKTDDSPQDFRDLGANVRALSFFTGKPQEEINSDYEQQKQQFVKDQGWDMPTSEGQFQGQLANYFNAQDAKQAAIEDLHTQAIQDAAASPSAPDALQKYQEWSTQHASALAGVPESEQFGAWKSGYWNTLKGLQGDHYDLAKQIVDQYGNLPAGQQEATTAVDNLSLAAEGLKNPIGLAGDQPQLKKDQVKQAARKQILDKLSTLTPEARQKVYQHAAALEKAKNPEKKGFVNSLYSLGQSFSRSLDWISPDAPDASTSRGRIALELHEAAKNTINPLPYSDVNAWDAMKSGGPIIGTKIAQGLAAAVPTIGAFALGEGLAAAAPTIGAFALGKGRLGMAYMFAQTAKEEQTALLLKNPTMSPEEALGWGVIKAVPETALQSITFLGIAKAFPGLTKYLGSWASGKLGQFGINALVGTGAFFLSETISPMVDAAIHERNPDWNTGSNPGKDLKGVLLNSPQDFGMALAFSLLHIGHPVDIGAGRQEIAMALNEVEKPDAPSMVKTQDGQRVIFSPDKDGTPKEVFRTKDDHAAANALEMLHEDKREKEAASDPWANAGESDQAASIESGTLKNILGEDEGDERFSQKGAGDVSESELTALENPDISALDERETGLVGADVAQSALDQLNSISAQARGLGLRVSDAHDMEGGAKFSLAQGIAGLFERRLVIYDGPEDAPNGIVNKSLPDYIFLNKNGDKPVFLTLGHELWHHIENTAPDLAKSLQGELEKITNVQGIQARKGARYSADKMRGEAYADLLGNLLSDPEQLGHLIDRNPSFWGKVGTVFQQWLDKVVNALRATKYHTDEYFNDLDQANARMRDVVSKFAENPFSDPGAIAFDHPDESQFSLKEPKTIRDEIQARIESSPDQRVKIYERMLKGLDSLAKTSASISKQFEQGKAKSSDLEKAQTLRSVAELNAIVSALPPEVRSQITRNWRNPQTGEPGNIYTKFASLGGEKARAGLLRKTIERSSDIIDHQLSSEYLDRGYQLLDASQPKNESGKGLKGKLGADVHSALDTVKALWHMDAGQVADYINTRQRELIALDNGDQSPENADSERNRLAGEIAIAQIHGNFSPWNESGDLKVFDNPEMDSTGRLQAVEHLKQTVRDGRFDWNAERSERGDKWDARRQEVKKALLGREGDATSAEIKAGQKKASGLLGGASAWFDSHLTRLQLLDQLLGPKLSYQFKREIWDASNAKADLDHKIDAESHGELIRSIYGEDAKDSLPNRTRLKRDIANLSTPKDTGAEVTENRNWKKVKIERVKAEGYVENPGSWKGTDSELNYLARSLKSKTRGNAEKSRIKQVEIYEPEGEGDKVELHLSEMEAIQRLLSWRQPDARIKFERGGMTQETADKLEEFVRKTPEGSAFFDYLKTAYDRYDEINAVYREMFGVDMPRVKNYSPTDYDTAKGTENPIALDEQGGGGGSMPNFAITRQNHAAKIRDRNAWVTFQAHNDAVNYWLSHAPMVRDYRAVFGNADVLRAAEAKNGKGRDYLVDLIKTLGRDNMTAGNLVRANSMFARVASDVLGNSSLAFNVGVTAKHLIPALSSSMKLSPSEFITSGLRVATGSAERNPFGKGGMYDSDEVKRFYEAQHSGSDNDAAQAAKESGGSLSGVKIALSQAGKWGHSWITEMVRASNSVSASIAYDATYRSAIKEGLTPEEAHALASDRVDEILHEVSQQTFPIDRPIGEEQGMGPLLATLARFDGLGRIARRGLAPS